MIRQDVIDAALSFEGTPFHHQGRAPRHGLDCAGVIVCAARAAGMDVDDRLDYGRNPNPRSLMHYLERNCERLPDPDQAIPGDLLVFWFVASARHGFIPQHVGLLLPEGEMVHALNLAVRRRRGRKNPSRVQRVPIDEYWKNRLHSAWRLRPLLEEGTSSGPGEVT